MICDWACSNSSCIIYCGFIINKNVNWLAGGAGWDSAQLI